MITEEKRCPRCRQIKPRSEFYPNPEKSGGLWIYCKDCESDHDNSTGAIRELLCRNCNHFLVGVENFRKMGLLKVAVAYLRRHSHSGNKP